MKLSTFKRNVLTLTGAVVLGATSVALTGSVVDAKPRNPDHIFCFSYDEHGITGYYEDGDEVTVTDEDGKTTKFRCNGETGQWEEVTRLLPGSIVSAGAQVTRTR